MLLFQNSFTNSFLFSGKIRRRNTIHTKDFGHIFTCPKCGKIYHHKKTLSRHVRQECGIEPEHQCPHCPYRARRAYVLQSHIKGHRHYFLSKLTYGNS